MKKAYYYLFYKFYRFFDSISDDSWSDFKALVMVGGFDVFVILSIDIYIKVLTKKAVILDLPKPIIVILFLLLATANYFVFLHRDRWKEYVEEFNRLPKRKNLAGSWIVFVIILVVISNLIFSFYLMSQINWSQYR